jgi:hypothetical protein
MTVVIIDCVQGEPEWFAARKGIPTASEFATVCAKGEGKTRRAYLYRLAGEIITDEVITDVYTNKNMERGKLLEQEAREYYSMVADVEPTTVGFIRNDQRGCSPDALIGNDGLLELKTAFPHILIDRIMRDDMPPEHKAQCQGGLLVAEREWFEIGLYWPKVPMYRKRVYRDEKYIAMLDSEINRFNEDLAQVVETIKRYGGIK